MPRIYIHCTNANKIDPDTIEVVEKHLKEQFGEICNIFKSKGLLSSSIVEIVFSLDLEAFIEEYNAKWHKNFFLTKEKEYSGIAINLSRHYKQKEEVTLAISLKLIGMPKELSAAVVNQILIEAAHGYLPPELLETKLNGISEADANNLDLVINNSIAIWFTYRFTQHYLRELNASDILPDDHNIFLINFKRNIRMVLYNAQSDDPLFKNNWLRVWGLYVHHFTHFITNLIRNHGDQNGLKIRDELEAKVCYEIVDEVDKIFLALIRRESFQIAKIKELFIKFGEILQISVKHKIVNDEHITSFKFNVNPKKIFGRDVVDTLPNFVSFVDILGFSQMIEEYKKNSQSTLLQDLKLAFDSAIEQTKKVEGIVEDHFLQYRLFSDNFSAAIPFFESKEDYLGQLAIICILLKNYQFSMMENGFYVRGGLSHGDYYSDANMIFSGALVEAYYLESSVARYPRILIHDKIINEIERYLDKNELLPERLRKVIIYSPEENMYFLNPYMDLEKELSAFIQMVDETTPEFSELLKSTMNLEDADLSDEKMLEKIQEELQMQIDELEEVGNTRAKEKLDWLFDFNIWYLNNKEGKYVFYRS